MKPQECSDALALIAWMNRSSLESLSLRMGSLALDLKRSGPAPEGEAATAEQGGIEPGPAPGEPEVGRAAPGQAGPQPEAGHSVAGPAGPQPEAGQPAPGTAGPAVDRPVPIRRVLVANRGEIAVRVIRACQGLGIETAAVVSEADRESLAARMADRVLCIGPAQAKKSYLDIPAVVRAALDAGADAIHPGYGFLAERPEFAEACAAAGLIFIGPKADHLRQMGDKLFAREMAASLNIPVIPGSFLVSNLQEAAQFAAGTGYPLLLKAAAGGGGRGMKILQGPEELQCLFNEASAEAGAAFGDNRLYMEKYLPRARHVEVQVLGDGYGNVIHLYERDCSIQRRYQKVLEESPATILTPAQREGLCASAVAIARHIGYRSAGTVEFILDQDTGRFYFLEMNTRIQVEHPVTEMVTGIDLIQEQIRIASGEPLGLAQADIRPRGHAIECRINAESPDRGFSPSPGRITIWRVPSDPFVRVDSHGHAGCDVPPYYDSLLAKLVVHGRNRQEAIERMGAALARFEIAGVDTNIELHRRILEDGDFRSGRIDTGWLERAFLARGGAQAGGQG